MDKVVVWNIWIIFDNIDIYYIYIYGMSSFPLTNSYFSRLLKPPTSFSVMLKNRLTANSGKKCYPRIAICQNSRSKHSKDIDPEQSGLEFTLACAVSPFLNVCVKTSRARIHRNQAGIPGICWEWFNIYTCHSLFLVDSFVQGWRSRNAE